MNKNFNSVEHFLAGLRWKLIHTFSFFLWEANHFGYCFLANGKPWHFPVTQKIQSDCRMNKKYNLSFAMIG